MAISFFEFMLGHGITEVVFYASKKFARPQFKRLTGKEWPQWERGLYRIVLNSAVMLFLGAIHHTGLAVHIYDTRYTVLQSSLPNTCEACIASMGPAKAQSTWPCQRDALYEWSGAAMTGKIDLGTLLTIAIIRQIIDSCLVAIAWNLFCMYFKLGATSLREKSLRTQSSKSKLDE